MANGGDVLCDDSRNCTPKQPQNTKEEPYIYELQKKQLPKFAVTLNPDVHVLPELSSRLKNHVVQTLKVIEKRDDLKRKSLDDVPIQNKNVKVMPDSIAERGEEMDRSYCIAQKPLTVKSSNYELTLVVRNKVPLGEPSQDGMVFTPSPGQAVGVSSDEAMDSAAPSSPPSDKKQGKRKRNGRGSSSDESMGSNGNSSDDNCEDRDYETVHMDANRNGPLLQTELLNRCTFDNLDTFKEHFEHAYSVCDRTRGGEHCFLDLNCRGQETKDYIDREITIITQSSAQSLEENVDHQNIVSALFHHSMNCNITLCSLPLCDEFRMEMRDLEKKDSPNSEHWKSSIRTDAMDVLYSNTNHFIEHDENGNIKPVMEDSSFNFVHEKFINKGSFGYVYDTWLHTPKGQARVAVKKSGGNFSSTGIGLKTEFISDLGTGSPYLLLPNVVLSSQSGFNYLIMDKAEMSLSSYCRRQLEGHKQSCQETDHYNCDTAGLPSQLVSLYFYQMAQGVKYLHNNGYTHGDIKPDNVLLMPGLLDVKLCDFDSIKKEEEKLQFGTHGYMAPEVSDPSIGNVLKSSDVFSLCSCIPEMLIGYPMKNKLSDDELKRRTEALNGVLKRRDPYLGVIFEMGMQWEYKSRPTIDKIVECFQRNNEMRQRVSIVPGMDVPLGTIPDDTSSGSRTLSRIILDKWIDNIMNEQLRPFLTPVQAKLEDEDEIVTMETDVVEQSTEDIPLELILS